MAMTFVPRCSKSKAMMNALPTSDFRLSTSPHIPRIKDFILTILMQSIREIC